MNLRRFIVRQKFRFQLGMTWFNIFTFALLLLASSDKLKIFFAYFNITTTSEIVLIMVPLGIFTMWAFGLFMDRVVQEPHLMEKEVSHRSGSGKEMQQAISTLGGRIEELTKKIDKLEAKTK